MTPSSDPLATLLDLLSWVALDLDEDGRVLAVHDELGSLQLVEIDVDGTTTPLTDLPSRCVGRYLPGRRQVVVEHDHGGDEQWQLSVLDLSTLPAAPVGLDGLTPLVHDPEHLHTLLDVTPTSVIYCTNRRNDVDMDVVVRDLSSGEEQVVFDSGGYVVGTTVSHDGASVVVTGLSLQPNATVLAIVDDRGERDLTGRDERADHAALGWSADDRSVLVTSDHERDHKAVFRISREGAWEPVLEADGHDLTGWLSPDGGSLLVGHHEDGLDRLALHEIDGTHRADVDLPPVVPVQVAWSADSSGLVVTAMGPTDPGSVVRVDAATGATTVLVDGRDGLPAQVRDHLVTPTVHRVPTPDGELVPCFRYAAPDPYGACVIHVHGGPEAEAQQIFSPVLQGLALAGFDVLVPNVRGSAGYGKRWYSLDDVELRLDSVADLAALHAWLPSIGLDPDRAALWGGSYGGYMVLAGVAMQPDLWGAGVDIVGMSSLVTFLENTSAYRRAYREKEYGTLEHDRDFLVKASPITYLDDLRAPLFVIHGANDPRVPLSEAQQIAAALADKGVPHELKVYDDEGHGLAKRVNRLDAYPAAVEFLLTHL